MLPYPNICPQATKKPGSCAKEHANVKIIHLRHNKIKHHTYTHIPHYAPEFQSFNEIMKNETVFCLGTYSKSLCNSKTLPGVPYSIVVVLPQITKLGTSAH